MKHFLLLAIASTLTLVFGTSCSSTSAKKEIKVSVAQQKLVLLEDGKVKKSYPVSTSKFGLGDRPGSCATPLGRMVITNKIGSGAPAGMVFKGRQPTGQVVKSEISTGDRITSRILRLAGRENGNSRAYGRCIYIHGTTAESAIGTPASYGCIRMKNRDIIDLFDKIPAGTAVTVVPGPVSGGSVFDTNAPSPQQRPSTIVTPATRPVMAPSAVATPATALVSNTPMGPAKNDQKTIR